MEILNNKIEIFKDNFLLIEDDTTSMPKNRCC